MLSKLTTMNQRIPRVAIIGLFQGGKSLLVNAALGGCYVPVGKHGLRTTPCRIKCRHGVLNRAVVTSADGAKKGLSISALSRYVESSSAIAAIASIDLYLSNSLLRDIELIDTPGIDFSEDDNTAALQAARDSDAVVLIIQQALPTATDAFRNLIECLKGKLWGMVLNCGRAGPHLEFQDSQACREVEDLALRQLLEFGLQQPTFTQRVSARTLSYYASQQFDSCKTMNMSEEHQEDLVADEESIDQWRRNLSSLGMKWMDDQLGKVSLRIIQFLHDQHWSNPHLAFDLVMQTFTCRVDVDGGNYEIFGNFRVESMSDYDHLVLHNFQCKDVWIIDWIYAHKNLHYWKFE